MKKFSKALRGSAAPLALALGGISAAAMFAAPAAAQDYTNVTASGRIVSTDGEPIADASITIVSNAQGFSRTATTNSSGTYRIGQVPAGNYTVTVSADGYETFTDPRVTLSQNGAANQFALVPVGGSHGEIIVTAGRTEVVDFNRTTTGLVVKVADLADRVPVARDLTSIIELSPGTTQGDTAFGNLPNIGGSSVSENQYFVNGLNITDFRKGLGAGTVPFDFYETVEVKNGGYQAEFGPATGGVINATTKSGSNEYHASLKFNWEPDGLRSDSPYSRDPYSGNLYVDNSMDGVDKKDAIIQASGPIIKDRLFVYGLYQFRDYTTNRGLATSNIYENRYTDSPFWAVKVDAVPIDGHRLEFTYFDSSGTETYSNYTYDPETDIVDKYEAGELYNYGGKNYVGRYTGNFTDWLTVSAAYGKSKLSDTYTPSDPNRPYVADYRSGELQIIGNPSNTIEFAKDEREFYRGDVDVFFEALGSHHIRGGYYRENLNSINETRYTGGVAYSYYTAGAGDLYAAPGVDYAAGRTFINGGTFSTVNDAFYIQDNWSLMGDRLQLQLGIRNDRFRNKNADGVAFYESGDQWGPRAGFTFDVFDDGRAKLYGSFGRYFLPIPANTNIRLAGAEFDQTRYNVLEGVNEDGSPVLGAPLIGFEGSAACLDTGTENCEVISNGTANPTEALVSKSLKPQSMDEYIIGGEMRFGEKWVFGLYGTYRSLNRSLEDSAIDAAVNNYCADNGYDRDACEGIWSGFHQYVLINPGDSATITLSDPLPGETDLRTIDFTAEQLGYPAAKRTYKAITATFEREFDGVWSLQGSYTWSKLKGNTEGGVKSDNGQDDSGITTDFDQPGLTNGAYGYLPPHREHNFKIFGSYQPTNWLVLGGSATVQSPRKFGCIGRIPSTIDPYAGAYGAAAWYCNVDGNGDIISDPSVTVPANSTTLTPRGSQFDSDWLTEVSLSAVFKLPVEDFDSSFRVDVFNIFNSKAKLDFEERGTLSNFQPRSSYGVATGYQTPRYVRFQFQMGF
ncbi:TonB-dependent receptor plug domain-containing protein [Altererythrobacter indicus]|uniref:TonB-dependent receptor plug domain-containing protein n=1 Tax=Altericroceibacterium indicum TaxID=374177 RepID=A0A845ACD5_9SPHN|nr:TonB-dependent receptor [Altericroceibacterium indicum]MXP26415.1 TonB-dependent receptor plug domain-containing protein [Altericroceibacterium indicum]